jgi:hypothetical protein
MPAPTLIARKAYERYLADIPVQARHSIILKGSRTDEKTELKGHI